MMRLSRSLFLVLVAILLQGCAGLELAGGNVSMSDNNVRVGLIFTSDDRAVIARYYSRQKTHRAPPGLARKAQLPPGLVKRDTLPPGLRGQALPAELERQLSPLAAGYVRVIVGDDLVLMNSKTRVVMDLYRDIVR